MLLAVGLLIAPCDADAADFYAGKTITFIVGTDVGGGSEIYRAHDRQVSASGHLPGTPVVVVKNMPGAGGCDRQRLVWPGSRPRTAPRSCRWHPTRSSASSYDGQGQYDPARIQYLGWCRARHAALHDLPAFQGQNAGPTRERATRGDRKRPRSAAAREYASMIKHAVGAKFEIVSGYKGPADLFIAMERGEIDGTCGLDWTGVEGAAAGLVA